MIREMSFGETYKGYTVKEMERLGQHLTELRGKSHPFFYYAAFDRANQLGKN